MVHRSSLILEQTRLDTIITYLYWHDSSSEFFLGLKVLLICYINCLTPWYLLVSKGVYALGCFTFVAGCLSPFCFSSSAFVCSSVSLSYVLLFYSLSFEFYVFTSVLVYFFSLSLPPDPIVFSSPRSLHCHFFPLYSLTNKPKQSQTWPCSSPHMTTPPPLPRTHTLT